jgi:hypothetical protein
VHATAYPPHMTRKVNEVTKPLTSGVKGTRHIVRL